MNIDFTSARFKHLNWRFRIRNFLDGKDTLTSEQAYSHTECDLGIWLYSYGLEKYKAVKEMQDLEQIHLELHDTVKKIVLLKQENNTKEAEELYKQMVDISAVIMNYLDSIEKIVSNKN